MGSIIAADTKDAGEVLGVHGGEGAMRWLRAATGAHLAGEWDGIEWVSLSPGGRAGLHTHSMTEELWFFLAGEGRVELDGESHRVEPGSIMLTPLDSNHAAWNTGTEPLEFVVIEVFPPAVTARLPRRRHTDERPTSELGEANG